MAKRFEEVVDILDYNELMRFKSDLDSGAITIKKLLEENIKKKLKEHEKTCATCSNTLNFYKTSNYTIVFGPDDFKKKASFCGLDCLEYFINKLKTIRETPKEDNVSKTDNYFWRMKNKRGQIEVFTLLGILVLIAGSFIIINR